MLLEGIRSFAGKCASERQFAIIAAALNYFDSGALRRDDFFVLIMFESEKFKSPIKHTKTGNVRTFIGKVS